MSYMTMDLWSLGYEQQPQPKVDSWLELDSGARGYLLACDDWDKADFRLPVTSLQIEHAVNVYITGRLAHRRWKDDGWSVRVSVDFVGDGEPTVTVKGWMYLN